MVVMVVMVYLSSRRVTAPRAEGGNTRAGEQSAHRSPTVTPTRGKTGATPPPTPGSWAPISGPYRGSGRFLVRTRGPVPTPRCSLSVPPGGGSLGDHTGTPVCWCAGVPVVLAVVRGDPRCGRQGQGRLHLCCSGIHRRMLGLARFGIEQINRSLGQGLGRTTVGSVIALVTHGCSVR